MGLVPWPAMPDHNSILEPGSDLSERPPDPDLFNLVSELGVVRRIRNPINEDKYRATLTAYLTARNDSNLSLGSGYPS